MTPLTTAVAQRQPTLRIAAHAFLALLWRDVVVLAKKPISFAIRVIMQPLMLVFVFAYVFPRIGQGIGGSTEAQTQFSTLLAPGIIASAMLSQGVQAVAFPLVQEFGYTREIEDRVMAPLPLWGIAAAKIVSGAVYAFLSALVVLPFALTIPDTPVILNFNWFEVVCITALACLLSGALGLAIGTMFDPRNATLLFATTVLPMTFLGACYYPWERLETIEWLQYMVLVNPLVYISEGMRAGMTDIPHMSTWGIFGGLLGFTALFTFAAIVNFRKRVLS